MFDFAKYKWVIVSDGEGSQACVVAGDNIQESLHKFMCFCGKPWEQCESGEDEVIFNIRMIDDPNNWTYDDGSERFSMSWSYESGRTALYRLSEV